MLFSKPKIMVSSSSILDLDISYQANAWSDISKVLTIRESLNYIKLGAYKAQVERLRDYLNRGLIDTYNEEKRRLPAVTFCANFGQRRNKNFIRAYNSVLVIDIDKLTPNQLDSLKSNFFSDPCIMAFWESPSKAGIKGLISLDYENKTNCKDYSQLHLFAFKIIHKYFLDKYSIELDVSGSDIPRLCFFSCDENLYLREFFQPFKISVDETVFQITGRRIKETTALYKSEASVNKKYNPYNRNNPNRRYQMYSIIKFLTKRGRSITESYRNWYQVAFAIANTFTYEIGIKYYLTLCKLDGKNHNETQSISMLNYCYENTDGNFTFGTLIYFAKEVGYKERKEVLKVGLES
jgi:hypothetical protein